MADFVDNFFGNSFDDPKSQAVMALASGLMGGDWRKGVNGYLGAMGTAGEYNSKKQLQQMQMQEMMVKAAAEKQKMEMDAKKNKMLMDMLGGGQPSQASSSGLLGDSAPQGGLLGGGAQGGGDPFAGVDKRALMLDYLQNGGKKMSDMVYDRTKPNWVNMDGNLVNTNAPNFNGGFQAGVKINENGQAIMQQPDGRGGVIVGAAPGSLDTFAAFESIKAGNKPIQVYNPTTGRMDYETEGNVVKAAKSGTPKPMSAPSTAPSNGSNSGYWGGSKESGLASRLEVLQSEINNPKNSPANRAAAQRELTQTQIDLQRIRPTQGAQSGAFAAAPSALEVAQNKAEEAKLIANATANAKNVSPAIMDELFKADDAARAGKSVIKTLDEALKLNNNAYSGVGAKTRAVVMSNLPFESKAADATINLDNMLTGQALDSMKAIFGSNPTEGERQILLSMQASADKTPKQRQDIMERAKAAASSRIAFNEDKAKAIRAGTYLNEPINSDKQKQSRVIDALPTANNGNKGQRIRDTSTGKILRSNGISWVAE